MTDRYVRLPALAFTKEHHVSHIVTLKTEIRDHAALCAACQRLQLAEPVHETVRLFSAQATGWTVRLSDWRYPVVCHTDTGQLEFDNFNERWGKQQELDRLVQRYAVEKAKIEARRRGNTCTEQQLADGSVKLTVTVGGVA
jgi:hypothetical protein